MPLRYLGNTSLDVPSSIVRDQEYSNIVGGNYYQEATKQTCDEYSFIDTIGFDYRVDDDGTV